MGKTTVTLDEEKIDSRARDEGRMCGYEITTSKDDSDTSSSKTAWIYNSVSVNGTKIPKLTIEYYDKEDYTDCPHIAYKVYDEGKHWSVEGNDGGFAGDNEGEDAMAARALQATVSANGYSIPSTGVKYRAYSDEAGWSDWKTNGAAAGETSKTYNMKAIEMQWNTESYSYLPDFELYYRVYVPGRGWLGWAKDGQTVGDYTKGNYISAMEAIIVPKMYYQYQYIDSNDGTTKKGDGSGTGKQFYSSCVGKDYIYNFNTTFKEYIMCKKHKFRNTILFLKGNVVTDNNGNWIKGNLSTNGITQLKIELNDIAMRSRYNVEYTGSVSTTNVLEESWKKNGEWLGKTFGGEVLNNVAVRIVPKDYQKGKKACFSNDFQVFEDGYSFQNDKEDLGYDINPQIELKKFTDLYGETIGNNLYNVEGNWKGSCFGMALACQMMYHGKWNAKDFVSQIDANTENVYGLETPRGRKGRKLIDLLEYCQISWWFGTYGSDGSAQSSGYGKTRNETINNLSNLVRYLQTNEQKYIMVISKGENTHAVIPLAINLLGNNKYEIIMYDVNNVGKTTMATVDLSKQVFRYNDYDTAYLIDVYELEQLYKDRYSQIMSKVKKQSYQMNSASYMKDANIILAENVAASQITNAEGKCIEDIDGVSKVDNFDNPDKLMYYVPEGTYHVDALENKDASITFVNYDASVSYDNLKEGEIVADFKKDDSIESNMKLDNTTDKVEVSTYDKHENENSKTCSGKQIKVISEDNHASIKVVK